MNFYRLFTLCLITFYFSGTTILEAAYSNPSIRVLLFKTSSPVILQSLSSLNVNNGQVSIHDQHRVEVRYYNNRKLIINQKSIHKRFIVATQGPIILKQKGRKDFSRYWGKIELHPFSGGMYVINVLPMESYLEGVLNAEISTKWDLDVVKAQAIIARTFALFKRQERGNKLWHVTAGHGDQVYLGLNIADARGRYAIKKTHGMAIHYKGKLAQTFYHSNCGGITEDPSAIWNNSMPYLRVRNVPYGQQDPRYYWSAKLSQQDLLKILRRSGQPINSFKKLRISSWTTSNRVATLEFRGNGSVKLLAKDFRRLAGYQIVQSLLFDITEIPDGYLFEGQGNGHGVGLCQWAAKEMADLGYTYEKILKFFYFDIQIRSYRG